MTESSEIQDNIIQLGKLLIDELGKEPDPDVLSGWIAHYIAELISKIETELGEEKEKAQSACFDAIMRLWDHRYSEKVGFSGIRDFKAIFDTLEKLHPDNPQPIYFRPEETTEEESQEVAQLVNFATHLDRITRRLLLRVLNMAAQAASAENTKQLLETASSISIPKDLQSIQLILNDGHEKEGAKLSELDCCLREIEAFAEMAISLARSLRDN